jgi:hypothetical protein
MTVTSYTSPSVSFTNTYPCSFAQCPYGAEFWADSGKWNADATGAFFRHFDPDPAQVGLLNGISAAGDDFVTMAASEYKPPFLNHTRFRRINYDLKNGAYDYPTGWRNPYYVEYPIEAVRLFQFGTVVTSVGAWYLRLPLGALSNQPIGPCDLALFSTLVSDGSASKVTSFGAANLCFAPYKAWQVSATQIIVATKYSSTASYTFPSGSLVIPTSSMNDSVLILFSTTPPPPVAPTPPAAAPTAPPMVAPTAPPVAPPIEPPTSSPTEPPANPPVQPPQPDPCRTTRCSGRGECVLNSTVGCICDSGSFGSDCSCNNPVVSPLSYCLDGGSREIVVGNITANSTSQIVLVPGGVVSVNGSLTLSNGTLRVVVLTGSSGQIVADGCVTLDGTLVIETNEQITNGDVITIVRAPCIQGNFTNVAVQTANQPCVSASTVQQSQSLAIIFTVSPDCSNANNGGGGGVPWYAIAIPVIAVAIIAVIVVVLWIRWRNNKENRASTHLRQIRESRIATDP